MILYPWVYRTFPKSLIAVCGMWFKRQQGAICRPFLYARLKKGAYYAVAMSVRPSVCPSVRPSVRPRLPDFSSTCFEISIWNLVYTFSRWHDMSSLSYITIGSFWPSLQPKVVQTHFLQSWPHKSVLCKSIIFRNLAIIFVRFGFFEVFQAFFYMFWDISFKLGICMQ